MTNEEIQKQFQFFAESDWNSQRIIYLDALARLAVVTAERDQARQMLADAPHGDECRSLEPYIDLRGFPPCDCWKAGL